VPIYECIGTYKLGFTFILCCVVLCVCVCVCVCACARACACVCVLFSPCGSDDLLG
jgi:hypothetical protein